MNNLNTFLSEWLDKVLEFINFILLTHDTSSWSLLTWLTHRVAIISRVIGWSWYSLRSVANWLEVGCWSTTHRNRRSLELSAHTTKEKTLANLHIIWFIFPQGVLQLDEFVDFMRLLTFRKYVGITENTEYFHRLRNNLQGQLIIRIGDLYVHEKMHHLLQSPISHKPFTSFLSVFNLFRLILKYIAL